MTIARFVLGLGAVVLAGCTVTRSGESVRPSHIPVASRPVKLSGLQFVPHKGWISREPASRMRVAEYDLASPGSGGRNASLVVYYFGPGSAGSVDANIERWCSQFTQPDGRDSYDVARIDTRHTQPGHGEGPQPLEDEPVPLDARHLLDDVWRPLSITLFDALGPELCGLDHV